MAINLRDYQLDAIKRMHNGTILCGGVGSGKSRTALAYYYMQNGGKESSLTSDNYFKMIHPKDLYIITTAKKRDSLEWEGELGTFFMSMHPECNIYSNKVIIDSWNNIKKYSGIKNSFFILDEQRLLGNGTWVKSFYEIAKNNEWILLSATPGDCWSDYIPVFIANGFYKNITQFRNEHIIYSRCAKYPKIDRYINTRRLERLRDNILVNMDFCRSTIPHHETIFVNYNSQLYKDVTKNRWNIWEEKPFRNASELCYALRKIVNTDLSRQVELLNIINNHPRVIVFYNYDYERDILLDLNYGDDFIIAEWSGHKHQEIPNNDKWIYLVQYTAGAEGWNCIKTDTIVFYSQTYSYKVLAQACGRIDRLNTPYKDLYYYHFKSRAPIDLAISRALAAKKKFNETKFTSWTNDKVA